MGICVEVWKDIFRFTPEFSRSGVFFNIFQSSVITADLEEEIHSGKLNDPFHGKSSGYTVMQPLTFRNWNEPTKKKTKATQRKRDKIKGIFFFFSLILPLVQPNYLST